MRTKRLSKCAAILFGVTVLGSAQSQNVGAVGRGVSVSFQNASGTAGRGVSIAFGSSVPPAAQIKASYGLPGTTRIPSGSSSEPVNTATGNYYSKVTDLSVPGRGLSFVFSRSYNSADSYNGPLGIGWTHSFNVILTVNPDSSVGIQEGDGGVATFSPSGGGNYTAPAGVFDVLVANGDGSFTLTQKDQTRFNFSSAGALTSVVDKNGNTQSLTYDGSGRLASITDSANRTFNLVS